MVGPHKDRRAGTHAGRSPKKPGRLDIFAVVAPGLEDVARDEVASLVSGGNVARVEGGVAFSGPLGAVMDANLRLRIASRVLVRVGVVQATGFDRLIGGLAALPWNQFVDGTRPLKVAATTHHCRLRHTGALAERLALAVGRHLGRSVDLFEGDDDGEVTHAHESSCEDEPFVRLFLRGDDDRFVVSVDSSGPLLHRRGWRRAAGAAPLRETLAAGVLALVGQRADEILVDGMCGSGTLAVEGALRARHLPPGLRRGFAFQRWPSFDAAAWGRVRAAAEQGPRVPPHPIFARDEDAAVLEIARGNAVCAGVDAALTFQRAEFFGTEPPAGAGLLVLNPPYGRRLSSVGGPQRLFRQLGRALERSWRGFRAAVLAPPALAAALGKPAAVYPVSNGGLRLHLCVFGAPRATR